MKTKKLFLMLPFLLLVMGVVGGCDKDAPNNYYKGEVILLNEGDGCPNIIEIVKTIDKGLPIGSTIYFNPDLYNKQLEFGSVVYFKIISYQKAENGFSTCMRFATYSAIIEFYND